MKKLLNWLMDVWEKWQKDKERRYKRYEEELGHIERRARAMLTLNRRWFTNKSTMGELLLDGEFQCHTLEDTIRDPNKDGVLQKDEKVYGETAIPAGTYEIVISFSDKFKKKLPMLMHVPHFDAIRIHSVATAKHTKGCIGVGNRVPDMLDFVANGRDVFSKLMPKIEDVLKYRKLYIEVIGGPTA